MDSSDHHRMADELAAKAEKYLGQGDGQESAAVWAAVAQVHATLALAAAMGAGSGRQVASRSSQENTAAERGPEAGTPGLIESLFDNPSKHFPNPT